MIGVLLLAASLLLVLLFAVIILAIHIKVWANKKDEEARQRFSELKTSIDETQKLFRTSIADILKKVNNILKDK